MDDNKEDLKNKNMQDTEEQEENPIDTIEELEEGIKKDLFKVCKQNGLDIEKLQSVGIQLEDMYSIMDKLTESMISNSAKEYSNVTGQDVYFDFDIENNTVKIYVDLEDTNKE